MGGQGVARGLTLIELLLVLLVIALMASLVRIRVSDRPAQDQLQQLAKQLIAQVQWAQDQAIIRHQDVGLRITEQGYHWLSWHDVKDEDSQESHIVWSVNTDERLAPMVLPEDGGIRLALQLEGLATVLPLALEPEADEPLLPQIILLADGQWSAAWQVRLQHPAATNLTVDIVHDGYNDPQRITAYDADL